ncbi:MAG: hypothetical protein AAGK37_11035 [Pseudomonadota bacterium]
MTTRSLSAENFEAAILAAQADFVLLGEGLAETWHLPAGRFELTETLTLGAVRRDLEILGNAAGTTLVLNDGVELSVVGARVALRALRIEAAGGAARSALTVTGGLSARLRRLTIAGAASTALGVRAPSVRARQIAINDLSAPGQKTSALELNGSTDVYLEEVAASGLSGSEVTGIDAEDVSTLTLADIAMEDVRGAQSATGLRFRGNQIDATGFALSEVHAETGPARGVEVVAAVAARVASVRLTGLSGVGSAGAAFEDFAGDGVTALRATAPDGRVADVQVTGLNASMGRALALRISPGIDTDGLSVARSLRSDDLLADLAAAQVALADEPVGSVADWLLPAGTFRFDAPLVLGVPERGIRLTGGGSDEGGTTLIFEAAGGGAIDDNVTGLSLTGSDLAVEALRVRVAATGAAIGVALAATGTGRATDLTLEDVVGASATGIAADADQRIELHDSTIRNISANADDAVGISLRAPEVVVASAAVADVSAAQNATGIDLRATVSGSVTAVASEDVEGAVATGALFWLDSAAPGTLSALDLRIGEITATGVDTLSLGLAAIARGDVELRAIGIRDLDGPRVLGALASATGTLDWLAGEITDLRGTVGGAAGLRAVLAPSGAVRDAPSLALRDIRCEAIRAAGASGQARPADSWLTAATSLAANLATDGPAALPGPGDPGHAEEVLGISITAPVPDEAIWLGTEDPGSVVLEDSRVHRVSGTALQMDCGLRDIGLVRVAAWTALDAGWIDGERVAITNVTFHRMGRGLSATTSDVTAANALFTQVDDGPGLFVSDGGDLAADAVFATRATAPLAAEPAPLPYRIPGPATQVPAGVAAGGQLAPNLPVDLSIAEDSNLHAEAIMVDPSDPDAPRWVGALPPLQDARCGLVDPAPPPDLSLPRDPEPGPFVDYLKRDARSFLEVMLARSEVVMPEWTLRTPGDQVSMMFEAVAASLDALSYKQEQAVANGFLSTATLRRAIEDHARLVDHHPDPGHSASAMLRFGLRDGGAERLQLTAQFAAGGTLTIPRDTLVVNPDATGIQTVFATEADLDYDPQLNDLRLAEDAVIEKGALSARIAGDLAQRLAGRWLTIIGTDAFGAPLPSHVVRVVEAQDLTDATAITWDPRRLAPASYHPERTLIEANTVPAHHGVPLAPAASEDMAEDAPLALWQAAMTQQLKAPEGRLAELPLPVWPISRISPGWPFPRARPRQASAVIEAALDGRTMRQVDDLSAEDVAEPRFALRPGRAGGEALVIQGAGDGGEVTLSLRVGLGAIGNVGANALTQILEFGPGGGLNPVLPGRADRMDVLLAEITVTNALPGQGGRDPHSDERVRADAPLAQRRALSAVAPRDYADRLSGEDDIAAARAVAHDGGLQPLLQVTGLLQDEDELARAELGDVREAERFRQWAGGRRFLESIRMMGLDVELVPPSFVPLDIDIAIDVEDHASADRTRRRVEAALRGAGGLFDPDRQGLGTDVTPDAIQRAVLTVEGVKAARLLRLRRLAREAQDYARAPIMPFGEVEVAILDPPYGGPPGVLTVSTCGGMP